VTCVCGGALQNPNHSVAAGGGAKGGAWGEYMGITALHAAAGGCPLLVTYLVSFATPVLAPRVAAFAAALSLPSGIPFRSERQPERAAARTRTRGLRGIRVFLNTLLAKNTEGYGNA